MDIESSTGEHRWHAMDVPTVYALLGTGPTGLDSRQVAERMARYGPNELERVERPSKLKILLAQVKSPLVFVLLAAALISLLAGKTTDTIVIAVVIVVNASIGFFQEYRAEEALSALRSQAAPEAEVVRRRAEAPEAPVELRIPTAQIVPGDIVLLEAGNRVPADARLVEAINLEVDEAMLTGESLPVRKTVEPLSGDLPVAERTNLVYGGTIVTHGRGRAVVYATGARTEFGKIARLIQQTEKAVSPLQRQTQDLGKKLGLLALVSATLIFLFGWFRRFPLSDIFMFSLASAVSSIPEGLPAVMSITLAVGVTRMARRNAIIRRLQAVDTLGAATVICTDKTGTITTSQMTVREIVLAGLSAPVRVTGVGFSPEGHFERDGAVIDPEANADLRLALQIGALCNDARLVLHVHEHGSTWEVRGDPTEGALVVAATKARYEKEELEDQYPRVDELPFSSKTKFMATFHKRTDGRVWVMVKGSPEVVIGRCTHIQENGIVRSMTAEDRERVLSENHRMAAAALRVLGLAYEVVTQEEAEHFKEALEYGHPLNLTFVALVGMMDPPRMEVPEAVQRCKQAGVRVIMATGDHKLTGEAVARQVGILEDGAHVWTGADVDSMSDSELETAVEQTAVFARVTPEHKYRIVEALRRNGDVVAMTGDGVNDAPALQAAEIGVAMGITGTDVAKETADMVLTDDNFASIVNAIEEGRVVFQNVRKVVKFLMATNIGETITLLGGLLLFPLRDLIVTPVQILWVNLVTDGLLDIAIAMEPMEGDVMRHPPRKPNERIINREILQNILYVALFMAAGTLWMFRYGNRTGDNMLRTRTLTFTTLAMFQVFNSLNCRSRDKSVFQLGLFSNRFLMAMIPLSVALQVAVEYVPFMQRALGTVPLTWQEWALIVAVSSTIWLADEVRKFVRSRIRRLASAA